jgi:hypothetical protein
VVVPFVDIGGIVDHQSMFKLLLHSITLEERCNDTGLVKRKT